MKFALVDFHDHEVEIVQSQDIVTDRDRKLWTVTFGSTPTQIAWLLQTLRYVSKCTCNVLHVQFGFERLKRLKSLMSKNLQYGRSDWCI